MGFDLCRDYLVTMGYPQEIREFEYDPSFALRYTYHNLIGSRQASYYLFFLHPILEACGSTPCTAIC